AQEPAAKRPRSIIFAYDRKGSPCHGSRLLPVSRSTRSRFKAKETQSDVISCEVTINALAFPCVQAGNLTRAVPSVPNPGGHASAFALRCAGDERDCRLAEQVAPSPGAAPLLRRSRTLRPIRADA